MRRKDRELSKEEAIDIIKKCDVCRIGLVDEDKPYVVPMNFGYTYEDEKLCLYFHCASEGRKLDLINKNNKICFEMDCSHKLITADIACNYTMEFESVIGSGVINVITEKDHKLAALNYIMRKYSDDISFSYDEKYVNIITILKLSVDEFTGKRLKK